MAPEALKRAEQHLMAWMQLQQRTIVVNRISKVVPMVPRPTRFSRVRYAIHRGA